MTLVPLLAGCGVLIFAGLSFFFARAESALFSLGKWQVRQLADRHPGAGGTVARLLAEPQHLLATIVLGNSVANAAMVLLTLWAAPRPAPLLYLVLPSLLALILIGCEVVPKTLALRNPEAWAVRVARPMSWLQNASRPVRQIAQRLVAGILARVAPAAAKPRAGLSDNEYAELVDLAFQQGTLARSEKEIILQIIGLDRRTAKDVMRPRTRMAGISDDLSRAEMLAAARNSRHSRLPMYDESPDTIVGILNARALLLDPELDLGEVIEFPSFVPESMNLLQLLRAMQRQNRGMAIVLDEFGGTAGLVTMQDILAEVVGDLRSENQTAGFVMERLGPGRWRVSGTMRLEDFRREYPALGEVREVDTLGGLLVHLAETVPAVGESHVFGALKLTATVADERRVRELMVEPARKTA